jgi:N-acetylmuramoyl-L-alanine amidase
MPAVLLEMGFLSNAEQEKQSDGRCLPGGVAQSIYEAVVRFRDSLNAGGGR